MTITVSQEIRDRADDLGFRNVSDYIDHLHIAHEKSPKKYQEMDFFNPEVSQSVRNELVSILKASGKAMTGYSLGYYLNKKFDISEQDRRSCIHIGIDSGIIKLDDRLRFELAK